MCLSQVGEFAFVLGKTARTGNVIGEELYMLLVSVAIVSLFLTPYLIAAAPWAAIRIQYWRGTPARAESDKPQRGGQPEVVIVGFGPAGQAVGRTFVGSRRRVLVIDLNAAAKQSAELLGLHAEIGDATNLSVLEHAGVYAASVVAVTIPARVAALTVLQHVRSLNPTACIVVRSRYQLHQRDFEQAGADYVLGDEVEVGESLANAVNARLQAEDQA
jgi:CPA2 family monovalent cation:H+ antiporter-2